MAEQGEHGISWTDATWNPLRGCTRVSEGCRNCYAERVAARFSGPGQPYEGLAKRTPSGPRWTNQVNLIPERLADPLRWQRPRRVFVNSMSDLWHESVPDEWIDRIFAVMALAPQHQFQVLTKRPERMRSYFQLAPADAHVSLLARQALIGQHFIELAPKAGPVFEWTGLPLPNVWLGVSCEDQKTAEARIPLLLQTPAAVSWVSAEPLLGPIALRWDWINPDCCGCPSGIECPDCPEATGLPYPRRLHWLVVGGESGPDARPMNPDWARDLREQCQAAGVPFHFKQHGEWCDYTTMVRGNLRSTETHDWPDTGDGYHRSFRVGKHAAGRLLDGREWSEYPEVAR